MDKRLQGCADIINGCIQCGKCKHLTYVKDADYMECSLGIAENTKGKCEKFEEMVSYQGGKRGTNEDNCC